MELQLRPAAPRFHPLMRPRRGFAGLGDGTCQVPQPGVAMVYPPCPTAPVYSGAPAVYQAPTPVAVPACTQDTRPGGAAFSDACIAQLLAAQQQNMAAGTAANYSVDRANCENAWVENDARYASMGLARPPNDCGQRTYGLTLPGTSGGTNILTPNAQQILDPGYTGPVAPAGASNPPAQGVPSSVVFTNLTSGNSAVLKVGDRWQIVISNAIPNAPVSVTGGQNGAHDTTPMGSTDSAGNWKSNGQITADQIGSWVEAWTVGGQPVGTFSFTVPGGTSGSASTSPTGGSVTGSFTDLLNKSVTVGGTSIPDWALIGAGLVVVFLMMRK
jgi:hypothetical protein